MVRCGATGAQRSTSGPGVEDCVCHLLVHYEGASLRELSILNVKSSSDYIGHRNGSVFLWVGAVHFFHTVSYLFYSVPILQADAPSMAHVPPQPPEVAACAGVGHRG